jgi:hypothetical protein
MTLPICARQTEVAALLQRGQWPAGSLPELRMHVESCRMCSDQVLLTSTFQQARAASAKVAALNSPGLLWWRAQLRRRNAAVERVRKPFLGAQIFALATYVVVVLGLIVSQARHGLRWLEWLTGLPQARVFHLEVLWPAAFTASSKPDWNLMTLLPGLGLLALFSGVIVYFASDKS